MTVCILRFAMCHDQQLIIDLCTGQFDRVGIIITYFFGFLTFLFFNFFWFFNFFL